MKPGKSPGAREVKVVLAFSPCLLCSPFFFPLMENCFHPFFFVLFWGGLSCDGQNVQDVQQHQFVETKDVKTW